MIKEDDMKQVAFIIILCTSLSCNAQTADPHSVYEKFKQQAKQEYSDFRRQANAQYAKFLEESWKRFNALPAIPKPKDETIPPVIVVEEDKDKPIENRAIPIKDVVTTPQPLSQPIPVEPIKEQQQPNEEIVKFEYYGTECAIRINNEVRNMLSNLKSDNSNLSKVWISLSDKGVLNNTIRDCLSLRISLSLCDWAYLNLLFSSPKPLSLYIPLQQTFEYKPSNLRTLISKRYPDVEVRVQVNTNMIDFYNTYPTSEINGNVMTRWAMYANTPLDEHVKSQLYPKLAEKISGLNQLEAANKLLNWVQTAFVYEYDDKVWGHDRAFFSEETLYYPYCDCEDRAILFTRLVRDLLGLQTILVYYPGHLACAVCFTDKVAGDYILLDGKRFVITDPTYIGAPVGKTMPDMDNTQASVILLN